MFLMLMSFYVHKKSNEVCIKAWSITTLLLLKGLVSEHRNVKWSFVPRKKNIRKQKMLAMLIINGNRTEWSTSQGLYASYQYVIC